MLPTLAMFAFIHHSAKRTSNKRTRKLKVLQEESQRKGIDREERENTV